MSQKKTIALITGGAQGIGYACAEAIRNDVKAAGKDVQIILADINTEGVERAAKNLSEDTIAITCDMAETDAIDAMFDDIENNHGPVTMLVNNAGIALPGDFLETSIDSALSQTGVDVEVIIVDDASEDGTLKLAKKELIKTLELKCCLLTVMAVLPLRGTWRSQLREVTGSLFWMLMTGSRPTGFPN